MLSGGFYKATIHRVVQPPVDQRGLVRLGLFYFALADDDAQLKPIASPALEREGVVRKFPDDEAPTMEEWRKKRYMAYGFKKARATEKATQEEIVDNGVYVLRYYN